MTVSTKDWTVALAGTGEVAEANALSLLDDWLPQEVEFAVPDDLSLKRKHKHLKPILDWAKDETIVISEVMDLVGYLKEKRDDGDDVYLVLAWDGTEEAEKWMDEARAADIPVKDLTRALDDLIFDEETVELPEEADDEPPWDTKDEVAGVVQTFVPDGPATLAPEATAVAPGVTPPNPLTFLEAWVREIVQDELMQVRPGAPGVHGQVAKRIVTEEPPETASVAVLMDEDGNYKLGGKGRPPKGWTPTKLKPSEAKALGLIED